MNSSLEHAGIRSILITGGTGTFGRAFARSALDSGIERVCIFSRGEHRQAEMREAFNNDERLRWFVGDVRDRNRLHRAMEGVDLVVHAAALKRVEVGEYNPIEMARTNVDGAINVIEAAADANVRKVVALSSDKACQPLNAYGASKLLAEKLFLAANNMLGPTRTAPKFAVTRYGNVSGSQGSVIPLWRAMLNEGHTVLPVTDPECTRFWMTIDEAVDLVAWTAEQMQGGELVVPDLPAYKVSDLALAMGAHGLMETGLRPGEKIHETMISEDEAVEFVKFDNYWIRGPSWKTMPLEIRDQPLQSNIVTRLAIDELRELLKEVA